MTHHKRKGGRTLELILLFGVLALSAGLILAGFFGAVAFLSIFDAGNRSGQLLMVGPILGALVSGQVWKIYLRHYKYDTDLKPIADDRQDKD